MQPAVNLADAKPLLHHRSRILFAAIAFLSLAGAIVSAVSLQRHYAKSATEFCDFNQKFSCDIVNRSEYSAVMGIPVAAIGVIGYLLLLLLATWRKSREQTPNHLVAAAIAGLAFALYLTYIEAYVLTTWCILCLISLLLIFLITVAAVALKVKMRTGAATR
jgi:vitamin-K-epoxide reductase (warfarin-sensitive)